MRELAKIARIQDLAPIEGRDRIELATVENYPVIVQKGEHKIGDLVVYIFYDTVLPQTKEFEFLRSRCWSELYQGFRIKNMQMGGVYSSGIVFGLSILPKNIRVREGKDVSDALKIRKYDPEALREEQNIRNSRHSVLWHCLMRFRIFRWLLVGRKSRCIPYPSTVKKSDEVNIEKAYDHLRSHYPDERYYITEKMEGQAMTAMLLGKKRKFLVYSRNMARDPKGNGSWETVARQYNLEGALRQEKENYAIQGEICMKGVQENIYGFNEPMFFVYKITNTDTGIALNYDEIVKFCHRHGLLMVPVLKTDVPLPCTLKEILDDCEGCSVFGTMPREGVVYRSMRDQNISFKAKSRKYAVWFESKRKTE